MELIQNNPYRIAGILSNATERELQKQKTKIKAYSKVGKEINSDYDFQVLDVITRTEDSIDKAFSTIEQNQDKVNYALFWFLNTNPYDNTAIDYLKNGDKDKAIEIWKKVTENKDINSKNFSAFNNLGTYKLLSQNQEDIKEGIEAKIKLIESDYFKNFVHSVADETFTIDHEKQIEKLVDELLPQFKNQYSNSEILQLFSNCNVSTQNYLSKKFTEEPLHNIESQISSSKNKRKNKRIDAYQCGLSLAANCKDDLVTLQALLGINDLKYKTIADQLANEIMQCGIDYFKESQETDSREGYLEQTQKLTKIADRIAIGKLVKDRVKDSLKSLEEMKDQEINQAIQVLKSIKDAYKKNERDIHQMIAEKGISIERLNIVKVMDMIGNSINWDKAVDLVYRVVPPENINKIKINNNIDKVNEYKKLVEFVLNKLNNSSISYSYKVKINYLKYWQTTTTTTSKTSLSSTSTKNTASTSYSTEGEGIPDWLKWVGGILLFIIIIKSCN